jgi:hypothetical protein
MNIPRHWIRYGAHPEKTFLKRLDKLYDGVIFHANMVAYYKKGIAGFITGPLNRKPFCIDPLTHAFGHSPIFILKSGESSEVKPAIKILSQYYGEPVERNTGIRPLDVVDFDSQRLREDFCRRIMNFEKNIITEEISENAKYVTTESQIPCLIIAPYFYMNILNYSSWRQLNLQFINISKDVERVIPVFGSLVVSKELFFDDDLRKQLLEDYSDVGCSGIFLWIASFDEHRASRSELSKYKNFIIELSNRGKKIISLYGGYFSIILLKYGLYGVTHGLGYGEERDVTPVGGGLPRVKYYFPKLHGRTFFREVAYVIRAANWKSPADFFENICDCDCCKDTIGNDVKNFSKFGSSKSGIRRDGISFEYQTSEAKTLATIHYLLNKHREFDFIDTNSKERIIEELRDSFNKHKRFFGVGEVGYLENWADALAE